MLGALALLLLGNLFVHLIVRSCRSRAVLAITALALPTLVVVPEARVAPWVELAAGLALGVRLRDGAVGLRCASLYCGFYTLAMAGSRLGSCCSRSTALFRQPQTTALHSLTVGAIGTITLAVMTRASFGHTGRPLIAGPGTTTIYVLVTLAAILRVLAPLGGAQRWDASSAKG